MDDATEIWDLEIKPKSGLFDVNLKELWHYRDLMWLFVRRDFVAQYKQTILGPLWHVIQPVFTTLMFFLIFRKIARIDTDGIEPILFYMSGITMWTYFSTCLTNTASTFVTNAPIFGKVYFPRLVLPISIVLSNIVKFAIQFGLLIVLMIAFYFIKGTPIVLSWYWLLIPALVFLMAGIGLGLGIIISSVTTKYRDFAVLITFAVQLGMYVTPIAYPLSFLQTKSSYKWLITINPITSVVEAFRYAIFGKGTVDAGSVLYSIIFMLVALGIGAIYFNKVEKTFMDTV